MSEKYVLTGEVLQVADVWESETSDFRKREFVVEIDGDSKYPQPIKLVVLGDKVALLDSVSEGDTVTAAFDIRGREYNERFYVDLVCWKLEVVSTAEVDDEVEADVIAPPATPADEVVFPPTDDEDDGLPF